MENPTILHLSFLIAAYLLGSFSSAITLSKIMRFPDPRSEGSHNPGATNVLRIAGKKAAALTLMGDLLKGFIPVLLAAFTLNESIYIALTGLAAFIGHCFPLYYGFKGGKGVATAIGFILAFDWLAGISVVAIWLTVAKVFKLSSLAAVIAFICLPVIYFWLRSDLLITVVLAMLTLILIYRHKENIQRLIKGTEDKGSIKKS